MPDDIERVRADIRNTLPGRIRLALGGYESFTADPPPADAKGFAAWHAAAKAALAHVELLVKLARWAEGRQESPETADTSLDALLAEARAALDGLDGDDDGEEER